MEFIGIWWDLLRIYLVLLDPDWPREFLQLPEVEGPAGIALWLHAQEGSGAGRSVAALGEATTCHLCYWFGKKPLHILFWEKQLLWCRHLAPVIYRPKFCAQGTFWIFHDEHPCGDRQICVELSHKPVLPGHGPVLGSQRTGKCHLLDQARLPLLGWIHLLCLSIVLAASLLLGLQEVPDLSRIPHKAATFLDRLRNFGAKSLEGDWEEWASKEWQLH